MSAGVWETAVGATVEWYTPPSLFDRLGMTFDLPGGVVSHRSWDEELRQLRRLQEKWGPDVVRFDITKSVNPVLKVPLRGV